MDTDRNFVWCSGFPLCCLPGWSEKLLAGTPCGYWHHGYITLLRGTGRSGLVAAKRQKEKINLRQAQQTNILFLPLSLKINSCILFLQLYAILCLWWCPFIHLPSVPLSLLFVPISPEKWVPLVLSEWTIPPKLISKESCKPLYCQCVVVWQPDLLN